MSTHPAKPHIITCSSKGSLQDEGYRFLLKEYAHLDSSIVEKGALLFRGFGVHTASDAHVFLECIFPNRSIKSYLGGLGHKKSHGGGVYSSTEVPSFMQISPHHEMAYLPKNQEYIIFFCINAPQKGGQTPLVCGESLYKKMDDEIREEFEQKGICYSRTYPQNAFGSCFMTTNEHPFFVSWGRVFGSEEIEIVEQKCVDMGLEPVWLKNNTLQTRVVLPAVRTHPIREKKTWYNQAHTFVATQKYLGAFLYPIYKMMYAFPSLRQGEASFGNGDPIPHKYIDRIHQIIKSERYLFEWQTGDVLVLDNQRIMHGRESYRGKRTVLTAML